MRLAGAEAWQKNDSSRREAGPQPAALLAWYDRNRRLLPWRALSGEGSDPYRIWLSEIMLQQTTVKTVAGYFARFIEKFPDVHTLAAAPLEEVLKLWAGLGYYARARNLHACARMVVEQFGGRFPSGEADLRRLPGIGAYTAAAIAAIAFGKRATPVDGNVERVVARLHALAEPLPAAKALIANLAAALTPDRRCGDFAQAMMDLGATICTPKRPACILCPWQAACAAARSDDPESFPRRAAKSQGRLRRGAVFFVRRTDGCVLVRTRPAHGLLGGMSELPTTPWSLDFDAALALEGAPVTSKRWRRIPGIVAHTFTHFPLELTVYAVEVRANARAPKNSRWVAEPDLAGEAFPSVMRKVIAHAAARW